jgi:hypothetical protein
MGRYLILLYSTVASSISSEERLPPQPIVRLACFATYASERSGIEHRHRLELPRGFEGGCCLPLALGERGRREWVFPDYIKVASAVAQGETVRTGGQDSWTRFADGVVRQKTDFPSSLDLQAQSTEMLRRIGSKALRPQHSGGLDTAGRARSSGLKAAACYIPAQIRREGRTIGEAAHLGDIRLDTVTHYTVVYHRSVRRPAARAGHVHGHYHLPPFPATAGQPDDVRRYRDHSIQILAIFRRRDGQVSQGRLDFVSYRCPYLLYGTPDGLE